MNAETPEAIFTEDARMAAIATHLNDIDSLVGEIADLGSTDKINEIVARLIDIRMSIHFLI